MKVLMMSTLQRGRGSKYTDNFKRKLVAESSADGVSVPMVAQRHGVPDNRIYAYD
jgi:transposase